MKTQVRKVLLQGELLCARTAGPSTITSAFYEAAKPHALDKHMKVHLEDIVRNSHLRFLPGVCWWNRDHCGSPGPHPTDTVHRQCLLSRRRGEQRASAGNWDHTYVVRHPQSKPNVIFMSFWEIFDQFIGAESVFLGGVLIMNHRRLLKAAVVKLISCKFGKEALMITVWSECVSLQSFFSVQRHRFISPI